MTTRTTIGIACVLTALAVQTVGGQVCQGDQGFQRSLARVGGTYEADEEISSYGWVAALGSKTGTFGSLAAALETRKYAERASPAFTMSMGQGVKIPKARRAQLCPRLEFRYHDRTSESDGERTLSIERSYRIGLDAGFAIKAVNGVDLIPFAAIRKTRDRIYYHFSSSSQESTGLSNGHSDDGTLGIGAVLLNAVTVKTYVSQRLWAGPYQGTRRVGVRLLAHVGKRRS